MKIEEVNSILRNKILHLINTGWLKTHIGKVLLGANGQAHLNHFLKENKDTGKVNDFGIKPLQKIGNVIGYDVCIAFVPQDNHDVEEQLEQLNMNFIEDLEQSLLNYLNKNVSANANIVRSSRTQIDSVLDDLLPGDDELQK
jgi:hypothetical protein